MPRKPSTTIPAAVVVFLFACVCLVSCDEAARPVAGPEGSPGGEPFLTDKPQDDYYYSPVPTAGISPSLAALLAAAQEHYNSGEFEKAAAAAEKTITKDDSLGPAYLVLGMARIMLAEKKDEGEGDAVLRRALEDFNRAIKCSPSADYRPLLFRGLALVLLERAGEAERDFRAISRRFSRLPDGPFQMGLAAVRTGDFDGAKKFFDEALKRNPDYQGALVERASILMDRENFTGAEADLLVLEKKYAGSSQTGYLRGIFHMLRGRSLISSAVTAPAGQGRNLAREGHESLRSALDIFDGLGGKNLIPAIFLSLASTETIASTSSLSAQHYDTARKHYNEILKAADGYPPAILPRIYMGIGVTCIAAKKETDALESFERAAYRKKFLPGILSDTRTPTIDKLLAIRAIADSLRNIALLNIRVNENYEAARKYLGRYLDFRPYASDREEMQTMLYDCELVRLTEENSGVHTFENCLDYLGHPYYKIRLAGLRILSRSGDPRGDEAIVGRLRDENRDVLLYVLELIKEGRLDSGTGGVAALFRHDDTIVATRAAQCVAALKAESAVPALIDALSDEKAAIREAAINALMDITFRSQGYHFDDPPEERSEAIGRWRQWWGEREVPRG